MKIGKVKLVVVYFDLDVLRLDRFHRIIEVEDCKLRNCLDAALLWNCRGLWGFIPVATVDNTISSYLDYLKLKDVNRDRPPEICFRLQDTIPVPDSVARHLVRNLK